MLTMLTKTKFLLTLTDYKIWKYICDSMTKHNRSNIPTVIIQYSHIGLINTFYFLTIPRIALYLK